MRSRRWTVRLVAVAAITAGAVLLLSWWQDRSLENVERQLSAGDPAGALAEVERYLAGSPTHGRALALQARALAAMGRVQEAAAIFEQVGAAEPASMRAWAETLLAQGQWDQAAPILEHLVQIKADDPDVYEMLTVCRFEQGNHAAAVESARQLSRLPGYEVTGHLLTASVYREWGYPTLAHPHYARVLELRPDADGLRLEPAEFFLAYGETLLASGNARRAAEVLARGMQHKQTLQAMLLEGEALQQTGQLDAAGQRFVKVLEQDWDHAAARQHLAEIALRNGSAEDAVRQLQTLVDTDRITVDSAYLLQRAYTELEDEQRAFEWQQRTAELRRVRTRLAAWRAAADADPQTTRSRLFFVYQAANDGRWQQAGTLLADLLRDAPETFEDPFVRQLAEAVRGHGELPMLESAP